MAIPPCMPIFMYLTGEKSKLELIKLIGWGISGLIAIFGVVGIFKRAEALDKQNTNNKDAHDKQIEALNKQHKMIEKGHVHERFKTATEHLDNERVLVRIAAFNEFYHVAEIEPDLRQTILNILCTHLRLTTKDENYQKEAKAAGTPISIEIKPTEEVQSLLNILFKHDNKDNFIFAGMVADLEEVYLPGANLQEAILQKANLRESNLQKAKLQGADLQGADLQKANLQRADLQGADLRKANLQRAYLQGADLRKAKLQEANLRYTNLQGADLQDANLQKAKLASADLQEAKMFNTQLQRAVLSGANLQKADLQDANLQGANLLGANLQGAYLQDANLQRANLPGANLQGARITKKTEMPNGWKKVVKIDTAGKTGVLVVNNRWGL